MGNYLSTEIFNSFDVSKLQICYPNFELSHSLAELEIMDNYIHYLPIHIQANYADSVTKEKCFNVKWAEDQFREIIQDIKMFDDVEKIKFQKLNTTAVGNVAYFALHAPTSKLGQVFIRYLNHYCSWRTNLDIPSNLPDEYTVDSPSLGSK